MRLSMSCVVLVAALSVINDVRASGENIRGGAPNADPASEAHHVNQTKSGDVSIPRVIGVCYPAPNMPNTQHPMGNSLGPIDVAREYFYLFEHQKTIATPAKVAVLQATKHGAIENHGNGFFSFYPKKDYFGKDSATLLVDFGGIKVKVIYFFHVVEGPLGNEGGEKLCSSTGIYWKISSTNDTSGNSTINKFLGPHNIHAKSET